jgi:hypothetical protein
MASPARPSFNDRFCHDSLGAFLNSVDIRWETNRACNPTSFRGEMHVGFQVDRFCKHNPPRFITDHWVMVQEGT